MTLLFGNLTLDFVKFATLIMRSEMGDQSATVALPAAADAFRKVAARDASYLVYIGESYLSGE